MIDWIDDLCHEWGKARHGIDHGSSAPTSLWGRMNGWHLKAADPAQRPDPPEVLLNGALAVSIAIQRAISARDLTYRQRQVMYVHYVERAPAKRKAYLLKLSRKRYYEHLHRCHRVIRYHLPEEHKRNEIDACQGDKIDEHAAIALC